MLNSYSEGLCRVLERWILEDKGILPIPDVPESDADGSNRNATEADKADGKRKSCAA